MSGDFVGAARGEGGRSGSLVLCPRNSVSPELAELGNVSPEMTVSAQTCQYDVIPLRRVDATPNADQARQQL